jgi:hypothetical protein
VSALLTAGGSIGIASNRPMQKFISTNPTDPINNWFQFTESNLVSHLPTMAFAYDRDGNGSYGNDYPIPLVLSVGATPSEDNARFAGKVQSNQLSVGAGNIDITNDAPQIGFNDTSSNNNKWWLHSNAYGIGPTMNFLYDRDNSGAWDAPDANPTFIIKSGTVNDGSQDYVLTRGAVRSSQYCDVNGANCFTASDVAGAGYSASMNYAGTVDVDTNISKSASCAMTGSNTGGCDSGASCGIVIQGNTWVVHQRQYGDCDFVPSCQYTCTGLAANPSYTYSWVTSAWTMCYPTKSCSTAGNQTRSSYCRRSDGTTASDNMCAGAKPTTSQSCTSPYTWGHDC